MATYASKTNPFIRSNCGDGSSPTASVCSIKQGPGKLQLKTNETIISTEGPDHDNLLLSNDDICVNKSKTCSDNLIEELNRELNNNQIGNLTVSDSNCCQIDKENEGLIGGDDKIRNENIDNLDAYHESTVDENKSEPVTKIESEDPDLKPEQAHDANEKKETDHEKSADRAQDLVCHKEDPASHLDELDEVDLDGARDSYEEASSNQDKKTNQQHIELIKKLRLQLRDLEKYAFERGELDQIPASVIAERQTVILNTLKERLSLSIGSDEIEKLELDELKEQVSKEVDDLIDPLITKEHLLKQLKTQLTDLERYINHLHGSTGKNVDAKHCMCKLHGCSKVDPTLSTRDEKDQPMYNDALPRTSRLIRAVVTQLICSDMKLRERDKKSPLPETDSDDFSNQDNADGGVTNEASKSTTSCVKTTQPQNEAAWTLHYDRIILATDSLVNLFTLEPQFSTRTYDNKTICENQTELVVRRQLFPAIRDLLSYGLIDPTSQKTDSLSSSLEKIHPWNIIKDYYRFRKEPKFDSSSLKTLSKSFDLPPTMSGSIKITSRQALLITVEDIIETMAKCKPNGPESHFKLFVYTALNRAKLATWLRLVFRNKSVINKYYHSFCFVGQSDKMDKFLSTIETLSQFEFKLSTDVESIEQFVSAF